MSNVRKLKKIPDLPLRPSAPPSALETMAIHELDHRRKRFLLILNHALPLLEAYDMDRIEPFLHDVAGRDVIKKIERKWGL